MTFTSITIQGNIISAEILEKIRSVDNYRFQQVADFGFSRKVVLREQIASAWVTAKGQWEIFKSKLEKLPEDDTAFTVTRKFWVTPLLYELGYDIELSAAEPINGKSYAINHRDKNRDNFPALVMGYREKLDRKPESGKLRMSPHALMQEYLNYTEHLYGLITNGKFLRLLRDSNRLAKLAYIEFDLEKIMEDGLYQEFAVLYRLLHASRMPVNREKAEESVIEFYHQESIDSGSRIREKLRYSVQESMILLAKGFLENPKNEEFIQEVRKNEINPGTMYRLLLRCMYRIIFLATIEERNLIYPRLDYTDPEYTKFNRLKNIYQKYYSIERIRNLVSSPVYINPSKQDLWLSLLATFRLFEPGPEGIKLRIQPLGGELFGTGNMAEENIDFSALKLCNEYFTEFFQKLSAFKDERGIFTRINYRDLDVEELGSVYEALLELHPYFNTEGPYLLFGFIEGSERKLTGSYYTRHDLVAQLIKTALLPMMEERLKKASTREEKEKALLEITVCDPAAGSGHFLIAAAKVMGFELARIRSGEENPGEDWVLQATRDIIDNCIYGVDKNPAAVELCRLSLWLTGHNSGKPL
ncbi:MAG: N-6 DNA methylase, partial [Bacteroidales bacterium]|nr:N-6 DNA methylase [Bacteroidales bacterium]